MLHTTEILPKCDEHTVELDNVNNIADVLSGKWIIDRYKKKNYPLAIFKNQ